MLKRSSNKQKVDFIVRAPEANEVLLAGNFTGWDHHPLPLKRTRDGTWKKSVNLAPGKYEYRYIVDGRWSDDPECPTRVANGQGSENCVKVVA